MYTCISAAFSQNMRHSGRAKELKLAIQRTLSGSNDERAGRTFAKKISRAGDWQVPC
jgi:hypothetical protein